MKREEEKKKDEKKEGEEKRKKRKKWEMRRKRRKWQKGEVEVSLAKIMTIKEVLVCERGYGEDIEKG